MHAGDKIRDAIMGATPWNTIIVIVTFRQWLQFIHLVDSLDEDTE